MRSRIPQAEPSGQPDSSVVSLVTLGFVALALGIPPTDILSSSRRSTTVYARHLAMYLLNTIFRMKHSHIGQAFGRDRSTASYACKVIEERRDDPTVEMLLGACEASLTGLKELAAEPALLPSRRRIMPAIAEEGPQ